MAEIYDNIETKFLDGLKGIIQNKHNIVKRVDFCVGYFNLRGWRHIADEIDALEGGETSAVRYTKWPLLQIEGVAR